MTNSLLPKMTVTHCSVFTTNTEGKLKAFARIVINDQLQLTSLRIYDGVNGLFVSYPNDPRHKGHDYRQLFYWITKDSRDEAERVILEEYNRVINDLPSF